MKLERLPLYRMHRLSDTGGADATPMDHNVSRTVRRAAHHLFLRMNKETVADLKSRMRIRARRLSNPKVRIQPNAREAARKLIDKVNRTGSTRNSRNSDVLYQGFDDKIRLVEEAQTSAAAPRSGSGVRTVFANDQLTRQGSVLEEDQVDEDKEETEQPDQYLWVGQDYVNIIIKDHTDVSRPFEMVIDRNTTPRMPWHDLASVVYGQCARDVARHFIHRWNMIKNVYKTKRFTISRMKNFSYPLIIPKSTKNVTSQSLKHLHVEKDAFLATCQVVRSIGAWSGGFAENQCERSIYEAYINMIDKAQHYIYIENQFLVSTTSYGGITLFNKVVAKIEEKILQAYRNPDKPVFRVYFVLPLIPGFPGQIGQTGHAVPQKIQNWMYRTLSQGDDSLFKRLTNQGVPITDYISVGQLRH